MKWSKHLKTDAINQKLFLTFHAYKKNTQILWPNFTATIMHSNFKIQLSHWNLWAIPQSLELKCNKMADALIFFLSVWIIVIFYFNFFIFITRTKAPFNVLIRLRIVSCLRVRMVPEIVSLSGNSHICLLLQSCRCHTFVGALKIHIFDNEWVFNPSKIIQAQLFDLIDKRLKTR